MTVVIDRTLCNGCKGSLEPLCMRICPGDLFFKDRDGAVRIRCPEECWDCASCMKACPQNAVSLVLPLEAGGQGGRMYAKKEGSQICWVIISPGGIEKRIYT